MTEETTGISVVTQGVGVPTDMKEFFSFLKVDMDEYDDFLQTLKPEAAIKLKRHLVGLRTGTHAVVPLVCPSGLRCPMVKRCPLTVFDAQGEIDEKASTWPVLRACPIEKDMMHYRIQGYAEEYELDITSPSTIALVTKLAELDIYEMRCNILLSGGDRDDQGMDLMREEVSTVDQHNAIAYTTLKIHPAWEIKKDIHKQRMELLDVLIGTPKSKIKAMKDRGVSDEPVSNLSSDMARLRAQLDKMNNADAVDAEFEEN